MPKIEVGQVYHNKVDTDLKCIINEKTSKGLRYSYLRSNNQRYSTISGWFAEDNNFLSGWKLDHIYQVVKQFNDDLKELLK